MPKDFDDMDMREETLRPQRRPAPSGAPQRRGGRRKKNQTGPIIILAVEIVVFIALVVLFFVLKGKIESDDFGSSSSEATEQTADNGTTGSGGVNVDSAEFTLTCTRVQLANDVNGSPAAQIFFTFTNKTDTPLSMSEVFSPALVQNGMPCSTEVALTETPAEFANKDTQISAGQSLECCFVFALQDLTSTLTLTIHDNYKTFTDIGSTDIPLS